MEATTYRYSQWQSRVVTEMGKMQGWTAQCTTLLAYSIFSIAVGSYGAYEHEFERGSMHSLYAGVRQEQPCTKHVRQSH